MVAVGVCVREWLGGKDTESLLVLYLTDYFIFSFWDWGRMNK